MPHIEILMYPGRNDEIKLKLAKKLQRTAAAELGIDDSVFSVSVKEIRKDDWEDEINKIPPENMVIKPIK